MIYDGKKYQGNIEAQGKSKYERPDDECYVVLHYAENKDMPIWALGYYKPHWLCDEWFMYNSNTRQYEETLEPELWIKYEQ